MRNYYFLVLFIGLSLQAQNIDLRWAEKINTRESVSILGGQDGNYYTAHKGDKSQLIFRKYDDKLALKSEKPLELDFDEKRRSYRGTYFLNGKMIHFVREHNRKDDKFTLFASTTDLDLNPIGKSYIIDEMDDDVVTFGLRTISPDSTKILVYTELKGRKKEPSRLSLKVYNTAFTDVVMDKIVTLNIKASKFDRSDIVTDNFGNVYVLAKIYKEKSEREKEQSHYSYKIFTFGVDGTEKEFDFDYPNRDIESIGFIPGDNNTLICAGFLKILGKGIFTSKKTLISDELFSSIIDCKTQQLKSAQKYELEGLYPEKPKKNQDYVPYKVKDVFFKPDGGAVLVAEQYKLIVTTHTTQYGTTTTYRYFYCDIACIHINANSEVESVSKMPKYQLNASNPSIISTYFGGNTYIIYEDIASNADVATDKEIKRSTKSLFSSDSKNALTLLTVLPSGEMKKEIIYSYKDSKIRPHIKSSILSGKNEIILNGNDQIGVLKFGS